MVVGAGAGAGVGALEVVGAFAAPLSPPLSIRALVSASGSRAGAVVTVAAAVEEEDGRGFEVASVSSFQAMSPSDALPWLLVLC